MVQIINSNSVKIANPGLRFLATIIDAIIASAIIISVGLISIKFSQNATIILVILLMYLGIPLYLFVSTALYGKTIGKKLMGIIIVTSNEKKLSWGKAFLREIIGKKYPQYYLLVM